jgi:hypothetical protein
MGQRWPAGMLFVRCKGGVGHNPAGSSADLGPQPIFLVRHARA